MNRKIKSVFITGMATSQCLGKNPLDTATMPVIVNAYLNNIGISTIAGLPHEYNGQDIVLMGLSSPKSSASRASSDCSHLWATCMSRGIGILPFYDDRKMRLHSSRLWELGPQGNGKPYNDQRVTRLGHYTRLGRFDGPIWDRFINWINLAPYSFLWPVFGNAGDREVLANCIKNLSSKPIDFDPSPIYTPYSSVGNGYNSKFKRWILPSGAMRHFADTPILWPLFDFGRNSTMGAVKDWEIQKWINTSWGCISTGGLSGSGWFKPEYLMSSVGKSVIVSDAGDGEAMGEGFNVCLPDIESMNYKQLVALAELQAKRFNNEIIATESESYSALMASLVAAMDNLDVVA